MIFGDFTKFLSELSEWCKSTDSDFWILNLGLEGTGKSNASLVMALIIDHMLFDLNNVAFNFREFMALFKTKNNSCVIADEGVNLMFNREAMTSRNKYLIKEVISNRYLNKPVIVNAPKLKLIDSTLREHRFHLVGIHFNRNGQKGHALFFRGSKIPLLIDFFNNNDLSGLSTEKFLLALIRAVKPDFYVKFCNLKVEYPEFWENYSIKKDIAHNQLLDKVSEDDDNKIKKESKKRQKELNLELEQELSKPVLISSEPSFFNGGKK